jgi:DNA-binding transcriptional regulator YiaG
MEKPIMEQDKLAGRLQQAPVPFAGETNNDYRARIAHHQAELQERRQRELLEQASTLNTPSARIRIWERLHRVSLPRDPQHRLLDVIATNTGLTIDEVRDEQRLRVAAATPAIVPTPAL